MTRATWAPRPHSWPIRARAEAGELSVRTWYSGPNRRPRVAPSQSRVAASLSTTRRIGSDIPASAGRRRQIQGRQRVTEVTPAIVAAGERPHTLDATTSEEQRHPGARGFVGSGAVEHDVSLARDLTVPALKLLDAQVQGARNDGGLRLEVQPVADVHHHHVLAGIQQGLELFRLDPGDPDLPQEPAARDVFPDDVAHESRDHDHDRPGPQVRRVLGHQLELGA